MYSENMINPVKDTIAEIQVLRTILDEQNKRYQENIKKLKFMKDILLRNKKISNIKKISYPNVESIKFNNETFWLEQLKEHYSKTIEEQKEKLNRQNTELSQLTRKFENLKLQLNNQILYESIEKNKSSQQVCLTCKESIIPCKKHDNSSHNYEYINYEAIDQLESDSVICIDCECVNKKDSNRGMAAVRVAAMTDNRRNRQSKQILLYHSFWKPEGNFSVFSPIVGITKKKIKKNSKHFIQRDRARSLLNNDIVKDRLVIFANSKSDINALELEQIKNFRDIQDYYVRYPFKEKQKEPMNLRWLTKYVLQKKIEEKEVHDPVIDASHTLSLYRKIPKEFWSPEWPQTTSKTKEESKCNLQKRKRITENSLHPYFIEEFEPDFSYDSDL